jgi:DHA3 family macrolide efflux protein-like MFS transporter
MSSPPSGLREYIVVWSGQFVSLLGSSLSAFGLGVYVYQLTGSATTLGMVYALGFLPMIVLSPIAGALVDRWGQRAALLAGNAGAMLVTVLLAASLLTHEFAVWHVYVVVAATSAVTALLLPAFASSVPLLVAKRHLGRANGMRVFALAASQVLAPAAGGLLLLAVGIGGIVTMDCLSFGAALVTAALVHVPRAPRSSATAGGVAGLLADFVLACRYVASRPGLTALLAFLGGLTFCAGSVELLITPLVLAFAPADALGTVLSIGGLGMVATSIATTVWGGPRRRVRGILGFSLVMAVATVVGSVRPSIALMAAAAFAFLGGLTVVIASNQSIWQTKVEPGMLGRAMALVNMVTSTPQLFAYALAGLLAERVFQPLVGADRVRYGPVATLVGNGPGRGFAVLLMAMGGLIAVFVVVAATSARLRHLEDELPDVEPGTALADRGRVLSDEPVH